MLKSILELLLSEVATHHNLWQTFIYLGSAIYALASTIWPPRWAITLVYLAHWAQDFLDQPRPLDQWKDSRRSFKRLSYMLDETCFDTCWLDIFRRLMFLVGFPQQNQPRLLDQLKHWMYIYKSLIYAGNTSLGRLMFLVKEGFPQPNQSFRPAGNLHFCSQHRQLTLGTLWRIATVQNCNCAKFVQCNKRYI